MRAGRSLVLFAAAVAVVVLSLLAPAAEARELHWRELAVTARLDADGRLHVSERHEMVFTGDWNGGERTFWIRAGQGILLHRVQRIDASGETIELTRGDLDSVDHWDWVEGNVRWRSRRPDDPPFDRTPLTYVLDYTLSGILVPTEDPKVWTLHHDFAFSQREGVIERLVVDLELDPVWEPPPSFRGHHEARDLPPWTSWEVGWDLTYTAAGAPAAAPHPLPFAQRLAFAAAAGAAILFFVGLLFVREAKLGRLNPPGDLPADPNRAWFDEHLLSMPAEQVGALWDRKVATAEVAGLLARLVAEGKLESEVEPKRRWYGSEVLHLRLKAPHDSFTKGYERALINKLFWNARTETDTEAVREHYQSKGFDPAGLIRGGIESALKKQLKGDRPAPSRRRTLLVFAACGVAFVLEGLSGNAQSAGLFGFSALLSALPPWGLGTAAAATWRQHVERVVPRALWWLLFGLIPAAGAVSVVFLDELFTPGMLALYPGPFGVIGILLVPVMVFSSLTRQGASRETRAAIRRRQELAHARRQLARQLRRERPDLDDRWLPHLIALDLGPDVSRWGKRWKVAAAGAGSGVSSLGGSSGSFGGGGSSWTGGGGAFGGAGASAAWATAASGMASSVAAPSSGGSGGGGGGGGGGSSGGGGGGGW
jgi:uncharacterized membrane protein YgcG